MNTPLWQPTPDEIHQSTLWRFIQWAQQRTERTFEDYTSLHQWSVQETAEFWSLFAEFSGIHWHHPPSSAFIPNPRMSQCRFMDGGTLNFAEHLLARHDEHPAIIETNERGEQTVLTFAELQRQVASLAQVLHEHGVGAGERVAAVLPNTAAAVIAMLATTQLGAVWTACSPDFGIDGLRQRFEDLTPSCLIVVDGHFYRGKAFDHSVRNAELRQNLSQLKLTLVYRYLDPSAPLAGGIDFNACLNNPILFKPFVSRAFNDPLYVLFSSGTTGKPKAMVHGIGGTLLQHLKELSLHTGLTAQSRLLFYTTTAWMMWHWMVSSLALGTTLVLYEGCPQHPDHSQLFQLIDKHGITHFGAGAKFFELCEQSGYKPIETCALTTLQCILSTGSVLLPSSFDYVYRFIKPTVRLSSISGGSDLLACFALGNPILPVWRGELQCLGLGMNVKIYNANGQSVNGEKGELVCATAFPSMPLYFWNDPDGTQYLQAYFSQFPNVWTHGDYAMITSHGGMIIFGRSDATLNPHGVRIGSAEIYAQLQAFPEIQEALVVGQPWHGDERIILFVILHDDVTLTTSLVMKIKQHIRDKTTSHHVPAKIIAVTDLPRTPNLKMAEVWVKRILGGEPLPSTAALANPDCLTQFSNCAALYED